MCGLIGVINREKVIGNSEKLLKFFYQGLYCDAVRGQHGTGICAVEDDGTYRMFKRALASADFIELSTAKKIMSDNNNVFLLGHNRHATYGQHTDDNSHPFVNDNITLFHNGTLTSHSSLNPGKTFSVDSNAISYLLSNTDDTITDLEKLRGAFALVWYDDIDESLNFARNNDRTLFLATIKNSQSILYASEKGMIEWLAQRNSIEIDEIKPLAAGILLSFPLDPTRKAKSKTFKIYTAPITNNYYQKTYFYPGPAVVIDGVKVNDVIIVDNITWQPYNGGMPVKDVVRYGYLKCEYKKGVCFHVAGTSESESKKYLGKIYSLQVQSVTSANAGYGKLLEEITENDLLEYSLLKMEKEKVIDIQSKKEEEKVEDVKKLGYTPLTKDELDIDSEDEGYIMVQGPGGKFISEPDFLKKVHGGCSNCSDDIIVDDAPNIKWDYENSPFCSDCAAFYNL